MSSVVKEGYLTKRAVRGVGSNRRRWITLRENSIEWSERQGSKPLGSMELDGETEVVVDSVTEITVEGLVSQYGRKTLSLIADDASDMQEWYQYIAACNGEYDGDDDAPLESDDDEPAPSSRRQQWTSYSALMAWDKSICASSIQRAKTTPWCAAQSALCVPAH